MVQYALFHLWNIYVSNFSLLYPNIQKYFKYQNMLKGSYDLDCITWSPQGKLFQVEYAMQAVKQGSVCLGLRSSNYAVLCSLKRLPSQLAGYQEKLFKVDDYIGMAMSGLTADARVLCKYMRNQCLSYKMTFGANKSLNRLLGKVADKSQVKTQRASKRPYGVGLLIAGVDDEGPHIFETCPSGNYYQYEAYSIGARSQSARTYLEDHFKTFKDASLRDLILHSLSALKKSASEQGEVKATSVEIGIVGKDTPFRVLKVAELETYLKDLQNWKKEGEMVPE